MTEFEELNARERIIYRMFACYLKKKMYIPFVEKLGLQGNEQVLDFGSGMGVISRLVAEILKKDGGVITCMEIETYMKELEMKNTWSEKSNIFRLNCFTAEYVKNP